MVRSVAKTTSEVIGSTDLIYLDLISQELGIKLYVKYEASNPGGSIKDRAAKMMIDQAEHEGIITPGESILVEPTSGNTGIGIALVAADRGYRAILVMPESMSLERRQLLAAYGAELVLTPASEGMAGAVACAQEIETNVQGAWIVGQFTNPNNPYAHEVTTGPEIENALGYAPQYFVAAVGTGGTVSGVGHYFNGHAQGGGSLARLVGHSTKIYAVEPSESPLIAQARAGQPLTPTPHGIQGIGANFIPDTLDLDALDGVLHVNTQEAYAQARALAHETGLLVGISSGANIAAVRKLVQQHPEVRGCTVVTVLVDTGERYLSTGLYV